MSGFMFFLGGALVVGAFTAGMIVGAYIRDVGTEYRDSKKTYSPRYNAYTAPLKKPDKTDFLKYYDAEVNEYYNNKNHDGEDNKDK